jgi:hypothetical protein
MKQQLLGLMEMFIYWPYVVLRSGCVIYKLTYNSSLYSPTLHMSLNARTSAVIAADSNNEEFAVPWLRRLVAGFPPLRPGFDSGSVHVGFVVDKVALGQVFPPSTSVFPCQFHFTGATLLVKMKKPDHLSLHLHHRAAQ